MNKLNHINDIEKILNNLGMNGKMIADKLRKCEKYESAGLEPEQIKSFLKDFGISVVMRNTKLMNELKEYKDLEEQGLLIKLPCKVGDIFYINIQKKTYECKISGFYIIENEIQFMVSFPDEDNATWFEVGETHKQQDLFITREEAEKALKGMEEK